jgi:hypothetical protein
MSVRNHISTQQPITTAATAVPSRLANKTCVCGQPAGLTGKCQHCQQQALVAKDVIGLQPKLTINQPGDRFEQEADRIADQVMRMPAPLIQAAPT